MAVLRAGVIREASSISRAPVVIVVAIVVVRIPVIRVRRDPIAAVCLRSGMVRREVLLLLPLMTEGWTSPTSATTAKLGMRRRRPGMVPV